MWLMNKKTFFVAFLFLCVTVAWLTINIVWWTADHDEGKLVMPALFVVAAIFMVYRQATAKKRRHVEDVKKYIK